MAGGVDPAELSYGSQRESDRSLQPSARKKFSFL